MRYSERLSVPLRWWVQATMLVATVWLAVAVAAPALVAGLIAVLAMLAVAAGFLTYGGATIRVDESTLSAGRAHIDRAFVGSVTTLDAEESRRVAGVDADARAWLLLRPYLKRSVRVEITDPADPAPYWLLSTRHPRELAAALGAGSDLRGPANTPS